MNAKYEHIAVIPARKNSKSLPFKNRFLFKHTAEFLKNNKLFSHVYVNSDDLYLKSLAKKYNFNFYKRKSKLAKDTTCIKEVFVDMINNLKFHQKTFIWLFYIPLVYKDFKDFKNSIKIVEKKKLNSICSFKKTKTHPMSCWFIKNNKPFQFIKNDLCRRQDFVKAYSHHHYICGFSIKFIKKLNNELISKNTFPILLSDSISKKLIEVDTPKQFKEFKNFNKHEKTKNN